MTDFQILARRNGHVLIYQVQRSRFDRAHIRGELSSNAFDSDEVAWPSAKNQ